MIRFKDADGFEWELITNRPSRGMRDATPDVMARAYHAMTNEQVLEMARAYAKLPRNPSTLTRSFDDSLAKALEAAESRLAEVTKERDRLQALISTPRIDSFLEAVRVEAAHQVDRWKVEHDAGKAPQDWFWLLGWLSGKAVHAAVKGDREKALHHTISSAAVLLNWHAHMSGESTGMRPGIAEPKL